MRMSDGFCFSQQDATQPHLHRAVRLPELVSTSLAFRYAQSAQSPKKAMKLVFGCTLMFRDIINDLTTDNKNEQKTLEIQSVSL